VSARARAFLLAGALLASSALGCGGSRVREPVFGPHPDASRPADGDIDKDRHGALDAPPPPVSAEEIAPAPSAAHVWIDGQWVYQPLLRRWTWEQGAWCLPPPGDAFYARPVVERYRRVDGRTTRWNEALQRFEEVDSGDDRFRWQRGRFYVRQPDGAVAPVDRVVCAAPPDR